MGFFIISQVTYIETHIFGMGIKDFKNLSLRTGMNSYPDMDVRLARIE